MVILAPKLRSLINKIGLSFILLDNFIKSELDSVDFRAQYVLYLLFIIYYVFVIRKVQVNIKAVMVLAGVIALLFMVPVVNGEGVSLYLKQMILIIFNLVFAYFLISAYEFDFEVLIRDYIQLITIAAVVALIQITSLLLGSYYGSDYTYLGFSMGNFEPTYRRVQSWFEEPSSMAFAFLPAVFVCLAQFFSLTDILSRRRAIFITVMFIMTQSSVGLIGFLAAIIILAISKYSVLRKPHVIVMILALVVVIGYGFYMIPLVKVRADDTSKLLFDSHVGTEDINRTNLSTYATYSNYKIAVATFLDHPVFGTGLGTHPLNYDYYLTKVVPPNVYRLEFELNKKDANSLFLRLISETGLVGVMLMFWFLMAYRIKSDFRNQSREQILYWVINSAVLVVAIARLCRQGHYTTTGFMLFLLLYFETHERLKDVKPKVAA